MAGKGPRPKSNSVRRNTTGTSGLRVYTAPSVVQPELPPLFVTNPETGRRRRAAWPAATKKWWKTWGDEPLSEDFTATDWDFLLDTALLHAQVWGAGDLKLLAELRLRVAKMGATAEDRARLRITYAAADEADEKRKKPSSSARGRRGPLKAV